MKFKKIIKGICTLVIFTSLNVTTFGANVENATLSLTNENNINVVDDIVGRFDSVKKNDSEMKAKKKAIAEKWNALSDAQKEEIYNLKDVSIDVECRIIDKYQEFGIVDSETAAIIKAKKEEYKTEMRTTGKLPGHGMHFKTGK